MKKFVCLGVALFASTAIAAAAQADPYASASLLPRAPVTVTLSGMLDIHGGMVVLVLDQPIALQATDGHSVDIASQSEIEVLGVMTTTKDFRPKHVTVTGTLAHGVQGGSIAVTVQRLQDTK